MLLFFMQKEELNCAEKMHIMDLIEFLIWALWYKIF